MHTALRTAVAALSLLGLAAALPAGAEDRPADSAKAPASATARPSGQDGPAHPAPKQAAGEMTQPPAPTPPPNLEIPRNMKPYVIGLLVRGPKFTEAQTPERMAKLGEHLAYIRKQIEAKRYVLAGPFTDESKIGGVLIFNTPSVEVAKAVVAQDPFVLAGEYEVELHPAMLPDLGALKVKYGPKVH